MGYNVIYCVGEKGDWEGLYINGVLKTEGHRLALSIILGLLVGRILTSYNEYVIDQEWLEGEAGGSLPTKFSAIPSEYLV